MAVKPQKLAQLVQLCQQSSSERSQDDLWFIRDRLHECSSFFRLWPSHLQQLLCRLVQAQHFVRHEVLAAAGSKPEELCFIVQGQAAVAVRSAPGSSLLQDVALLHAGDTFGESCLLGKQRHPAFVVVRSAQLIGLTVDAKALAAALPAALQQVQAASALSSHTAAGLAASQAEQHDAVSVDALYQLIGEPRGTCNAKLKPQTAQQVRQLHSKQLQEAAAAEAGTVGTWQQLPHQRLQQRSPTAAAHTSEQPGGQTPEGVKCAGSGCVGAGSLRPSGTAQQSCSDNDAGIMRVTCGSSTAGGAQAASQPTQQQQQAPRSPLMHHAAIMHFAALRAAAVGPPGS